MSANDVQHGGQHYKKQAIQVWDYVTANNIPYLEGNVIRYISRWRDKGGLQDLLKAKHYVEKLIELETEGVNGEELPSLPEACPHYWQHLTCVKPIGHKGDHEFTVPAYAIDPNVNIKETT